MVERMTGSDCRPTWAIWPKFRPKPSRMTAYWRIFFEVNCTPLASACGRLRHASAMHMPSRMPKTGPPTTGNARPAA